SKSTTTTIIMAMAKRYVPMNFRMMYRSRILMPGQIFIQNQALKIRNRRGAGRIAKRASGPSVPDFPFSIGSQSSSQFRHGGLLPLLEIAGEDVLACGAHQPQVEGDIVQRGDLGGHH